MSEIFAGGPCNIWFNIDISHSNTSLLGLDGDWDSKIGPQTVGGKVRRGRHRMISWVDIANNGWKRKPVHLTKQETTASHTRLWSSALWFCDGMYIPSARLIPIPGRLNFPG